MSIQFGRLRLLEEFDKEVFQERIERYLIDQAKASPDAARMLAKGVILGIITTEKAVEITRASTGLGEMSVAVGAGGYLPSLHATKKQRMGPELEEARNYHQFKREAATRSKVQQMHEAAKMINRKLEEINRLLEYTNQMRDELLEGEEQMEYRHNTKKLFEKINTKVVEAYTKLKKIK